MGKIRITVDLDEIDLDCFLDYIESNEIEFVRFEYVIPKELRSLGVFPVTSESLKYADCNGIKKMLKDMAAKSKEETWKN